MKKLLTLILALAMALSLVACGSSDKKDDSGEKTYTVGVVQLVQHEALDAATKGFTDALKEALGDKVNVVVKNASGDSNTCGTIVNGFLADNVDLIMANATPALQAAASATSTVPILGTSVTDYATALEIADWTGTVGGNISGTSDLAPLDQQVAMLQELFPNAKMACDASDVLFIPTDNTAASNTEAIANVVLASNTPVIAGESGLCKGCGVATLSIDYYELGKITGQMATKILTGEADVSTMPIQFAPSVTKQANMANCQKLGITVPAEYTALATE